MTVAEGLFAQRVHAREIMDDPIESLSELEASMRDVEFQNAWFGGAAPALRELDRIGAKSVLDVGTGSADIPLLLAGRADRRRAELSITCLDRSDQMLEIARKRTGEHPRLRFVQADGAALPFDDGAFDVAMCNLALHHFDPASATLMLRELRRVSRRSPLVCDLRRSVTAFAGAYAFSRVFTRNRVTRNDAPLSVRRAYTPSEALALAVEAGWRQPHVRSYPFFRMALVDG
jgi:ubiquinone/menaquinone biosynthesis C-methylase UbiE